jgi:predicted lipopolysaccharide heptosyltransferase III
VKILLVRLRLLGDVVFTTPLLRALRRRYPEAEITYVVEPAAAGVVNANPHLNRVIVAPRRRGLRRIVDDISIARGLRQQRFDIAIDLHGGPRGAWLTWASGAPMRIGYTTPGRTWMYTDPVLRPADLSDRHSVAKQWELLRPLGSDGCDRERDPVEMPLDGAVMTRVEQSLRADGIAAHHEVILVHVSAGNPFRRWPLESFAQTVAQLAGRYPSLRFVLTSGPSETDAARALTERVCALAPSAHVVHRQYDVPELRALAERATVYIGGDSGPMHIAATTGTPVVGLFGPTLPDRSMPWRSAVFFAEAVDAGQLPCRPCKQRTCAPGDFRCLTTIPPDRVVAAIERALAAARQTQPRARHA